MVVQTLEGHQDLVLFAEYSPDGQHIVSASSDHTVKMWGLNDKREWVCENTFTGHKNVVNSASFSPDGQHVVSTSYDGPAKIWYVETGECVLNADMGCFVFSAQYSPDSTEIVTACDDLSGL